MRYIKILSKPLYDYVLENWEQLLLEVMDISPFFSETDKQTNYIYFFAYINQNTPLNLLSENYKKATQIQELSYKEVKEAIESMSWIYRCRKNVNGKINIYQKKNVKNNIYTDPSNKPYDSWIWNSIENKWQAPIPHPIQPETKFVWDKISKKWIKNKKYYLYSWNEQKKIWQFVDDKVNQML